MVKSRNILSVDNGMYHGMDMVFLYRTSRVVCFLITDRTRGSRAPCRSSVVEKRTERENRTEGIARRYVDTRILITLR